MPLEDVEAVLSHLKQHRWQKQQSFEQLLTLWPQVVGKTVAEQSRPLRVNQRGILQVAVSSSVWAQNLAFERQLILAKINQAWRGTTIQDIHFSTGQWHRRPPALAPNSQAPDLTPRIRRSIPVAPPKDAKDAFQRWSQRVQQRSRNYKRCPTCQCLTPPQELQRWQECALCAARATAAANRQPQGNPHSSQPPQSQ